MAASHATSRRRPEIDITMNKRARLILALGLALIVAVGAYLYSRRDGQAAAGVLRVSGNIEVTSAEVGFKIPGRVIERLVTEGDEVRQGQVIARLESGDLGQQVALREASLAEAQSAYDEQVAGSRPEEIAAVAAALDRARADAEKARMEFARQRDMFERKLTSAQAFDAARMDSDRSRRGSATGRAATDPHEEGPARRAGRTGARPAGAGSAESGAYPDAARVCGDYLAAHRRRAVEEHRARRVRGPRHARGHRRRPGQRLAAGVHQRDRPAAA